MPGLLQNHIAVITGAGSGIGRAIALGFAREGARVAVLDANGEAAARTAAEINADGGDAKHFVLDVTDRAACGAIAREVADTIGRVSILVNNAGIVRRNGMTGAAEAVIKDWEDIIAVNLNGVFNVTHAFLEPLRAARGRIINIGSIQSFVHVRTPSSRPTPPPSMACSVLRARSPPNSARRACGSTRSGRASSRPRSTPIPAPTIRNW
jgi:3-oxoacyl-[acyl-carrier protein] reductase